MFDGFIKRMTDWLRKLFQRKKKMGLPALLQEETQEAVIVLDEFAKARHFLYEGKGLIGCPHSRRYPEIRSLPVKNFAEAYRFFIKLCDQRQLVRINVAGSLHYRIQLSDGTIIFDLTDKVSGRQVGTLAVLKINTVKFTGQISEIEFIKIRNK